MFRISVVSTLVLQSAPPGEPVWIQQCLSTVKAWAERNGYDYICLDDRLFEAVPSALRSKFVAQPVVLSDLARLVWTRRILEAGHDRVIWADADFLIFDETALVLPPVSFAFGREVWIERQSDKLRAREKVHNAFFFFDAANAFLDWYIHAAEQLLTRASGPVVNQFIGPKYLATQHNLTPFAEITGAAMISPLVIGDLINGGGAALDLLKDRQGAPIGGANLCRSHAVPSPALQDVIGAGDMEAAVGRLLRHGM